MKKICTTAIALSFLLPSFTLGAKTGGVVGYYTFDEEIDDSTDSVEIVDHSGKGNNVFTTAMDGTEFDDGFDGQGLLFNGSDECILLDESVLSGSGFSFVAWVNPQNWKPWMRILDIGDQIEDLWIGMDGVSGKLRMDVVGRGLSGITVLAPLPPTDEWTHIAGTIDGKSAKLYVNGKLCQRIPCPMTPEKLGKNVQGLFVGASNWAPDPAFSGVMDNVLVANRALSDKEITALYRTDNLLHSESEAAGSEKAGEFAAAVFTRQLAVNYAVGDVKLHLKDEDYDFDYGFSPIGLNIDCTLYQSAPFFCGIYKGLDLSAGASIAKTKKIQLAGDEYDIDALTFSEYLSVGPAFRYDIGGYHSVRFVPALQLGFDQSSWDSDEDGVSRMSISDFYTALSFDVSYQYAITKAIGVNVGADVDIPFFGVCAVSTKTDDGSRYLSKDKIGTSLDYRFYAGIVFRK